MNKNTNNTSFTYYSSIKKLNCGLDESLKERPRKTSYSVRFIIDRRKEKSKPNQFYTKQGLFHLILIVLPLFSSSKVLCECMCMHMYVCICMYAYVCMLVLFYLFTLMADLHCVLVHAAACWNVIILCRLKYANVRRDHLIKKKLQIIISKKTKKKQKKNTKEKINKKVKNKKFNTQSKQ